MFWIRGRGTGLESCLGMKFTVFEAKTSLQKQLWQPKLQTFFQLVFGSGKITQSLGVCRFFLSVKFATSLLASIAGGWNQLNRKIFISAKILLIFGKNHFYIPGWWKFGSKFFFLYAILHYKGSHLLIDGYILDMKKAFFKEK